MPFVVGCNRSGTTLLSGMLDSHPELAVVHESLFVPALITSTGPPQEFAADTFVDELVANVGFFRLGLEADTVRAAVDAVRPDGVAAAIRVVFDSYARAAGKPRYGEKAPDYVRSMPLIAAVLPESKFVHLIRDGRDVAPAIVDVPEGTDDLVKAARFWVQMVSAGRRDGPALGAGRYLEVRYEHLVTDPRRVLGTVCDFLELEFDPTMLSYHERADDIIRHSRNEWMHGSIRKPPTPGLRDWRRDLSADDLRKVEAVAGPTLVECGYELGAKRVGLGRLRALLRTR
jgi:hypothetical protein